MAPTIRYTAIPASLWAIDSPFVQLGARAQWLYLRLWTSEERDAAGLLQLQRSLWVKSSASATADTIDGAMAELVAGQWVQVDEHAEMVWLCRFIREDSVANPNQFVSALKRIQTCRSKRLREAAWVEVQRLGLPPVRSEKAREKMEARMWSAWKSLEAQMFNSMLDTPSKGDGAPYPTPFEGVSKVSYVNAHAHVDEGAGGSQTESDVTPSQEAESGRDELCAQCRERPARLEVHLWRPELCDVCVESIKHPTMRRQIEGSA